MILVNRNTIDIGRSFCRKPSVVLILLLTVLGFFSSTSSFALSTDKAQAIDITSEGSVRGDAVNGVLTYTKNVVLQQGSLKINSEELITHGNIDNYEKIIATGFPAKLEQLPTVDGVLIQIEGNRIEYVVAEEKVYVTGNVKFKQGGSEIQGPKFYYDVSNSFFEFDADDSEVKLTLPPKPASTDTTIPADTNSSNNKPTNSETP